MRTSEEFQIFPLSLYLFLFTQFSIISSFEFKFRLNCIYEFMTRKITLDWHHSVCIIDVAHNDRVTEIGQQGRRKNRCRQKKNRLSSGDYENVFLASSASARARNRNFFCCRVRSYMNGKGTHSDSPSIVSRFCCGANRTNENIEIEINNENYV